MLLRWMRGKGVVEDVASCSHRCTSARFVGLARQGPMFGGWGLVRYIPVCLSA